MTEEQIIDAITLARAQNNKSWMNLLTLALKVAPVETRAILSRINRQDRKISELLNELAGAQANDEGHAG